MRVVCADVIRNFPPKNRAAGCLLSRASQINKQLRMRYRKSSSLRAQVRFVCYGNLVVCYAHVHVKDFHDHIGKYEFFFSKIKENQWFNPLFS